MFTSNIMPNSDDFIYIKKEIMWTATDTWCHFATETLREPSSDGVILLFSTKDKRFAKSVYLEEEERWTKQDT